MNRAGMTFVTIVAAFVFLGMVCGVFRMTGDWFFCFATLFFGRFLITALNSSLSINHLLGKNKNTQSQNDKKYFQSS